MRGESEASALTVKDGKRMTRYALASSGGALHILLYNAQATPQSRRLNTAGDIQQPFLVLVVTVAITIVTVVAVAEYGIACTLCLPEALHQMQLAGELHFGQVVTDKSLPIDPLSAAKIHHS